MFSISFLYVRFLIPCLPWVISFFYGRFFILHLILVLDYFIDLWQIFHSMPHLFPGLFQLFMAGFSFCISSLPWIISFFYGRFFILCLIYALDYFIVLWQVFHSIFHLCPGLFHSFMAGFHSAFHLCPELFHCFVAGFSFCISSLLWIISLSYGRFFILHLILALDYFIYLWHIFHSLPHPCPG